MTVIFTRGIRIFTQSGGRRTWRATWRISNHKKAGDKFTLAHFFSPSWRACKALHSKVKEEKYVHCIFNNFTIIKRRKKCMSCINLHWYRVPFVKCPQRYINLPGCIQDCNLLWSTIMNRLRSVRGSMSMSCHCSAFTEVLKVKYVASAALFQP